MKLILDGYLFFFSNIQDMKSLETNEWKEKSQSYSLHIPMWDKNSQQSTLRGYIMGECEGVN